MRQRGKPFLSVEHLVQEIVQISSVEKILIGYFINKKSSNKSSLLNMALVYTCIHKITVVNLYI